MIFRKREPKSTEAVANDLEGITAFYRIYSIGHNFVNYVKISNIKRNTSGQKIGTIRCFETDLTTRTHEDVILDSFGAMFRTEVIIDRSLIAKLLLRGL